MQRDSRTFTGEPRSSDPDAPRPRRERIDHLDSWLDAVERLLPGTPAERAAVREELASHVRERATDLIVTGLSEAEAEARAIAEFGDAASLAAAYRRGAGPRWPALLAVSAGAAITLGALAVALVVGLRQPSPAAAPPAAAPPANVTASAPPASDADLFSREPAAFADFKTGDRSDLDALVAWFEAAALRPTLAMREQLEAEGLAEHIAAPALRLRGLDFPSALALLNESLPPHVQDRFAVGLHRGVLVLATQGHVDRLTHELRVYDVARLIPSADPRRIAEEAEQIARLITNNVEPAFWIDNGGEYGEIDVAANRLLVTAAPRIHERVAWILEQLPTRDDILGEVVTRRIPLRAIDAVGALNVAMQAMDPDATNDVSITPEIEARALVLTGPSKRLEEIAARVISADSFAHAARGATPPLEPLPEGWVETPVRAKAPDAATAANLLELLAQAIEREDVVRVRTVPGADDYVVVSGDRDAVADLQDLLHELQRQERDLPLEVWFLLSGNARSTPAAALVDDVVATQGEGQFQALVETAIRIAGERPLALRVFHEPFADPGAESTARILVLGEASAVAGARQMLQRERRRDWSRWTRTEIPLPEHLVEFPLRQNNAAAATARQAAGDRVSWILPAGDSLTVWADESVANDIRQALREHVGEGSAPAVPAE